MVKKTVNQDDPTVYHLFYADERGSAGADITFFEYPGAARGLAGDGMVHRIVFRVASDEALDFWEARVGGSAERRLARVRRPRRARARARVDTPGTSRSCASIPRSPPSLRSAVSQAFARMRRSPRPARRSCRRSVSSPAGAHAGDDREGFYVYDEPPATPPRQGAGTVHHVAWAAPTDEHAAWVQRVAQAGGRPTPVIDRFWFRSIYFREPSGVLFEIASLGPGFQVDEARSISARS